MIRKCMALPLMAAIALLLGAGAAPGSAQTLDELKAQIREMSQRLQELEVKQQELEVKTDETRIDSRTVISGKQGVKLTVSGQVNRGLLYVDNGDQDDLDAGRLHRVLPAYRDLSRSIYAVFSGPGTVSANGEAFVTFIELCIAAFYDRMSGRAPVLSSAGPGSI